MGAFADVLLPRVIVDDFTSIAVVISDDVSKICYSVLCSGIKLELGRKYYYYYYYYYYYQLLT